MPRLVQPLTTSSFTLRTRDTIKSSCHCIRAHSLCMHVMPLPSPFPQTHTQKHTHEQSRIARHSTEHTRKTQRVHNPNKRTGFFMFALYIRIRARVHCPSHVLDSSLLCACVRASDPRRGCIWKPITYAGIVYVPTRLNSFGMSRPAHSRIPSNLLVGRAWFCSKFRLRIDGRRARQAHTARIHVQLLFTMPSAYTMCIIWGMAWAIEYNTWCCDLWGCATQSLPIIFSFGCSSYTRLPGASVRCSCYYIAQLQLLVVFALSLLLAYANVPGSAEEPL